MATTPQDLLDALGAQARRRHPAAPIEDLTTGLGHLGRGLERLAADGITTQPGTPPEDAIRAVARWCTAVADLWQRAGGPLTDLAGVLADLAGRDSPKLTRAQRFALAVELSSAADDCARALAEHLPPRAAAREIGELRRAAATVERSALREPPTGAAAAVLQHPVPPPGVPLIRPGAALAVDALAIVLHELETAPGHGGPTLREVRAVLAAAQMTAAHLATVIPNSPSPSAAPSAVSAWATAAELAQPFIDGHVLARPAPSRIVRACAVVPVALTADGLRSAAEPAETAASAARDRSVELRRLGNLLPLLGEQIGLTVAHWARTERLLARAKDLTPAEDMPLDRVRQVVAGWRVPAEARDLQGLQRAVDQAADASLELVRWGDRRGWAPPGPDGAPPPAAPELQEPVDPPYGRRAAIDPEDETPPLLPPSFGPEPSI